MKLALFLVATLGLASCSILSPASQADLVEVKADVAKLEADLKPAEASAPAVAQLLTDLSMGNYIGAALDLGAAIPALAMAAPLVIADIEELAKDLERYVSDATAKAAAAKARAQASVARTAAIARLK